MSMWHGAKARRAAAVALAATALTVSLTACGGGGGNDAKENGGSSASAEPSAETPKDDGADGETPDTSQVLATMSNGNGLEIAFHSAQRDEGGFLTVTGTLTNTSSKQQYAPIEWNGQEQQVRRTGRSFAGFTLVDKAEKKRYYVLRDTDGYPLTTTGVVAVKPDEKVAVFAQFPAPPDSTTQVDIQLPLMPTATIEIS
ncbi:MULTISPECIES: hypothetical protein [unclassified Streptomyces]|uniref:hypothetical protein n=1 Tax=unclassified Streptomyces TaxID=2593676 RepID=UPI00081DFA33|nr:MULTISPECIES: hypothetical protein [unclassified Streptomyces]MYZ37076.1 hypothetical protein [Streptomyces sp. SID4917]SCF88455.1 hypothetical protein GA0115259_1041919 [Streptomyces sp. MnatMP-M17]